MIRFFGFVKTQDVEGYCGLWMRIDNALSVTLKLDNMQSRPIKGTTEFVSEDVFPDHLLNPSFEAL
jgi:hypothetical protein